MVKQRGKLQPWELYDEVSEKYIAQFLRSEVLAEDRKFLDQFVPSSDPQAPSAILDIGCGPGVHAEYWFGRGYKYVGLDLATRMLDWARRQHKHAMYVCGSAAMLPFCDNAFPAATAIGSLVHLSVDQFEMALHEIERCLLPGGQALLLLQYGEGIVSREFPLNPDHRIQTLLLTEDAIASHAKRACLEVKALARRPPANGELKFDKMIATLGKPNTSRQR